ncbi:MAG: hypothetical protein KDA75_08755, partial [Planctomycetaceae bacterium]|nr:hypothetical protein [Planctomycetaceae bacterium]
MASVICIALATGVASAGEYHQVEYPPSTAQGELPYGVTYTVWIPPDTETLRGLIVHQHGCGTGACKGGETAAYDWHWQALARRWNCALLGPSYHQPEGADCRKWCDPRNGSEHTFLQSLHDLAEASGHPELETVPWCLWGHSGGAFWSSLMQVRHPDRVVAIWLRSGTAYGYWESGEIERPDIPTAVYGVPTMCNPGAKERDHERFHVAWDGGLAMFQAYRKAGGLIGFAPDPRTAHECGDSRYLAIPYFSACLEARLPTSPGQPLRAIDEQTGCLAPVLGETTLRYAEFDGDPRTAVWLPSESVARLWSEYVQTGATSDATPPPAPENVMAERDGQNVRLTWDAVADFESGLRSFEILRDGAVIGSVPEKPVGRFGRPLLQTMSYHDTPEPGYPEPVFIDNDAPIGQHSYEVRAINGV